MIANAPFTDSLGAFTNASPWLDATHEPELTALRFLAHTLDHGAPANPAPLIAQWGLIMRSLRKQLPTAGDDDPLELALRAAEQ